MTLFLPRQGQGDFEINHRALVSRCWNNQFMLTVFIRDESSLIGDKSQQIPFATVATCSPAF